jgi:hypothetical protein
MAGGQGSGKGKAPGAGGGSPSLAAPAHAAAVKAGRLLAERVATIAEAKAERDRLLTMLAEAQTALARGARVCSPRYRPLLPAGRGAFLRGYGTVCLDRVIN